MANTWFRMHNRTRNNRKAILLSDANFRAWVNLLCLASDENGVIPGDFDEIAVELRCDAGRARDVMQILISARLMVTNDDGSFSPKDWKEWQYQSDSSTERTRQYRERQRKRQENVTVTAPDSDTDSDSEKKESLSLRSGEARGKGTRWPADAVVPNEWMDQAEVKRSEHGLPVIDIGLEAMQFANYWASKAGKGATKLDWQKTWLNWATDPAKTGPRTRTPQNEPRKSAVQRNLEGVAQLLGEWEAQDDRRATGEARLALPAR